MIKWTPTSGGAAHVEVQGRLDSHEAPRLREAFDEAVRAGLTTFRVRMHDVEFMDSGGLAALVSGLKTARQHGGELYVLAPSDMVIRVLELTLLNQVIPIEQDAGSSNGGM